MLVSATAPTAIFGKIVSPNSPEMQYGQALLPTEPIAFALVHNQLTIDPAYVECRAFDPHMLADLNEDGLWQFNGPVSRLDHGDKSQNGHGHGLSQGDSAVTDGLQLHAIRLPPPVWPANRPWISLLSLPDASRSLRGACFPSRRRSPTGPGLPGPGGAPHWTYDLDQVGQVWSPLVCGGWPRRGARIPEQPGS